MWFREYKLSLPIAIAAAGILIVAGVFAFAPLENNFLTGLANFGKNTHSALLLDGSLRQY